LVAADTADFFQSWQAVRLVKRNLKSIGQTDLKQAGLARNPRVFLAIAVLSPVQIPFFNESC
jgi:hypothetical protein